MEQEWPVISDSNYRFQIREEAKVEAILLGSLIKAKELTLPLTQEMGEMGEVEEVEEGEIPWIPMQQEQHPQIPIPIKSAIS